MGGVMERWHQRNWSCITLAGGGQLRVLPQWADQFDEQDFNPNNPALQARKIAQGGRQSAWVVNGAYGRGVLRHYRRGGWVAKALKDQYLWLSASRSRAFQEADCLNWMHARGLPVPRAIAAAVWPVMEPVKALGGLFYRAAIIVEYLPNVTPLALNLQHPQAVAQAIAAMHDANVWHADLNAFNILLEPAATASSTPKVWLIDFDRARRQPMTPARRKANLKRLRRSLIKVAGEKGAVFWEQVNWWYQEQTGRL